MRRFGLIRSEWLTLLLHRNNKKQQGRGIHGIIKKQLFETEFLNCIEISSLYKNPAYFTCQENDSIFIICYALSFIFPWNSVLIIEDKCQTEEIRGWNSFIYFYCSGRLKEYRKSVFIWHSTLNQLWTVFYSFEYLWSAAVSEKRAAADHVVDQLIVFLRRPRPCWPCGRDTVAPSPSPPSPVLCWSRQQHWRSWTEIPVQTSRPNPQIRTNLFSASYNFFV